MPDSVAEVSNTEILPIAEAIGRYPGIKTHGVQILDDGQGFIAFQADSQERLAALLLALRNGNPAKTPTERTWGNPVTETDAIRVEVQSDCSGKPFYALYFSGYPDSAWQRLLGEMKTRLLKGLNHAEK